MVGFFKYDKFWKEKLKYLLIYWLFFIEIWCVNVKNKIR